MKSVALGELMPSRIPGIDPQQHPAELFTLWSIPSYDAGAPIPTYGRDIGSNKKLVQSGDVILSKIVPHIRRAWTVQANDNNAQIASSEWIIFRDSRFLSDYVRHFLLSDVFHKQFMGTVAGVGGSLLRAQPQSVAKITIPLPPIEEQARIVALLDRAAAIRRRAEAAREKARSIIPALFAEMFGDPATNPKGWPVVEIGEILESAQYGTSQKANESGRGVPVIRMGNVGTSGDLDTSDLKYVMLDGKEYENAELRKGDILFNRTNSKELVGKTGIWDGRFEAVAASYFIRLRVDKSRVEPQYVWCFMNTAHMKQVLFNTARGAIGQSNINAKELKAFKLPLPSKELQDRFAAEFRSIRALTDKCAKSTHIASKTHAALSAEVFA